MCLRIDWTNFVSTCDVGYEGLNQGFCNTRGPESSPVHCTFIIIPLPKCRDPNERIVPLFLNAVGQVTISLICVNQLTIITNDRTSVLKYFSVRLSVKGGET